jgi:hypothetical protein
MTQATSGRRGQSEDSIFWDASKNWYIGAMSLGFSPSGTRIRKKVMGRTRTEVRDKLKELHRQVESGLWPRRRYAVGDALHDWLAVAFRRGCRIALLAGNRDSLTFASAGARAR